MKNVIITGTSRGIGFELVKYFAQAGHQVLALSRNAQTVIDLSLSNVKAISVDLTKEEDLIVVEEYIKSHWKSVDILINNAGAIVNKPFSALSRKDFEYVYQVNVFAVASLIQKMLPLMNSDGHVVAISSMGGVQGSVKFSGLAAYSSSKGALITLIELLAEEYKDKGPSFNVLALGAVQTEMLGEAFPGLEVPTTPAAMATYIADFSLTGHNFYNGKLLQVSNSTP